MKCNSLNLNKIGDSGSRDLATALHKNAGLRELRLVVLCNYRFQTFKT